MKKSLKPMQVSSDVTELYKIYIFRSKDKGRRSQKFICQLKNTKKYMKCKILIIKKIWISIHPKPKSLRGVYQNDKKKLYKIEHFVDLACKKAIFLSGNCGQIPEFKRLPFRQSSGAIAGSIKPR